MLKIYLSNENDELLTISNFEKGAWINLTKPTEEEIGITVLKTGVNSALLQYPLDEEERPHLEAEENQLLIIIDVPVPTEKDIMYETIPLGIIVTNDFIITVCLEGVDIIEDFIRQKVKGLATYKKTRFVFQILHKTASLYLKYLRQIDKKTDEVERELHKSMKNKELITLLNLEKSLVFFTTSLRANEIVMEKLLRGKVIRMYEEDEDLLEDVIIENKQAIEMANIYSNILTGTMDAFASLISNNLNIVLKFLAAITIILALPTMVASFFGMNVPLPWENSPHGFALVLGISVVISGLSAYYLAKKNMF